MNAKRLDELEALAAAATPGPWVQWVEHADVYAATPDLENMPYRLSGVRIKIAACEINTDYDFMGTDEELEKGGPYDGEHNAAFITATREAVPELCAEVRKLQALHGNYESMQETNRVLVERLQAVGTAIKNQQDKAVADGIDASVEFGEDSEQFTVAAARLMEVQMIGCAMEGSPADV